MLDISDEVSDSGEQGLLSIAFAPDFAASRLLYAYFTDSDQDQRVVEFAMAEDGATIDPDSRREVLRMDDFASNHNGGLLAVRARRPPLHRHRATAASPTTPSATARTSAPCSARSCGSTPAPVESRTAFRRTTPSPTPRAPGPRSTPTACATPGASASTASNGALAIGDVGQNSLEEIDYVPAGGGAGANFGWSAFEGTERFNEDQEAPGHVEPVLTYDPSQGCSVTGGYVVRDPELPALRRPLPLRRLLRGRAAQLRPRQGAARDDSQLGVEVSSLSSFGEDGQGRIYATSLDGPVFRLVP